MDTIVKVITTREDYDVRDSAENALTIEEVIEVLKYLPQKAKVVLCNDNGHTFAPVRRSTFVTEYVETKEEEEERIRKEEEEDEKTTLVCPNCGSDNIYWSVRWHMRCMSCDGKFNKAKKVTLA